GALARAAHVRGRAARRFDARRQRAPSLARELLTLARCLAHVIARRCPAGLTMVAHSSGRLQEGLRERLLATACSHAETGHAEAGHSTSARRAPASPSLGLGQPATSGGEAPGSEQVEDFLSGTSGTVGGFDAVRRSLRDGATDVWELACGRRLRLELAARHEPPLRRVLALSVVRPERRALAEGVRWELSSSRHDVQ